MKPGKIAIGLAVAGALAAPFVIGTWQPRSNAERWIALSAERRSSLLAEMERSKNCRYYETQVEARDVMGLKVDPDDISQAIHCHSEREELDGSGRTERYFSPLNYLATNGAVTLTSFVAILGLAVMVPGVFRRYRPRQRT